MKYYTNGQDEIVGFDFYCDIASNIFKERKRLDMTQADLAKKSGVSVSRVSAIEGVKTRILIGELKKIANSLGVTIDYLIEAEFGCHGKECVYLVWDKDYPDSKFYSKATSGRMAAMQVYEFLRNVVRLDARTRFCARLVGVPCTEEELLRRYPKRDEKQLYDDLEPDESEPGSKEAP